MRNVLAGIAVLAIAGAATAATHNVPTDFPTIQAAIDDPGTVAGDVIHVEPGTYVLAATVNVTKAVTVEGAGSSATIIQVSGTGYRFRMIAAGAVLQNMQIQKTDTTSQNIVYLGASNVSVKNNLIWGLYAVSTDPTTRAIEVAGGLTGLLIDSNTIHNLRQPAYINKSSGTVRNNYVYLTRGWVVSDGSSITFTGNTWGSGAQANYLDIAIIVDSPPTPPPGFYPDIAAISAANNGAVIQDQRVTPATLSVVYVDASAPSGGDGTITKPYQTVTAGITSVVAGGTIHVAAGTYVEQVEVTKDLTILGSGAATIIKSPATLTKSFTTSAVNKPIVFVHDTGNAALKNLTVDGDGKGNANYRFMGIAYWNAGGRVEGCEIKNVQDTPFSGAQHGVGVGVYNADAVSRTFTLESCRLHDIQKTFAVLNGAGLTATVKNNVFTGVGPTGVTAQNGIQMSYGVNGVVEQNVVTGFYYTGPSWGASAMLAYGAGNVAFTGNVASLSNFGLNAYACASITAHQNSFVGNDWGFVNDSDILVDAKENWWGTPSGATYVTEDATVYAGDGDVAWDSYPPKLDVSLPLAKPAQANALYLEPTPASIYIKPGESIVVNMSVANLQQLVNACQAILGYSSTYFADPTGGTVQAPGAGPWDQVIWDSWVDSTGVPGEIDTAIGVNANGAVGTNIDATVCKITLTARSGVEGVTQMVFRPDVSDVESTWFSDMSANPVLPAKINSTNIYIDGTAPTASLAATQNSVDVLNCANQTIEGTVNIAVTASDALSGLAGAPVVTVTKGSDALPVTFVNESPAGQFNYTVTFLTTTPVGTWTISATATDKADNATVVTGTLCFDRKVTGSVSFSTLSSAAYSITRDVTFAATDGGGAVLKTWTVTVSFTNDTGTRVASGSYALTDVPTTTANLSAKTAWSLRKKLPVALVNGQASGVDFMLLGGDVNGSNSVNVLDYSILKTNWMKEMPGAAVADVNGDGSVGTLDYSIMKDNWFKTGDSE